MTVAIIGSRDTQEDCTQLILDNIPSGCTKIISGGAVGVDSYAQLAAQRLGVEFTAFLPDYDKFGRSAPLIRNTEIISNADFVLGLWNYSSNGTRFVIKECLRLNKPVKILKI